MIGSVAVDKEVSNIQVLTYSGLYPYRDSITCIDDTEDNCIIHYTDNGADIAHAVEAHEDYAFNYPPEVLSLMMANATEEGTEAVDNFLNEVAASEGWGTVHTDPMTSARASAGIIYEDDSEFAKSRKESANSLDTYFYDVWEVANRIASEVVAGTRLLPDINELVAELPVYSR